MSPVRALTLPTDIDLRIFCGHLAHQRVRFRVFEEQGRQVLEVAAEVEAERVRADYAAWRDGRLVLHWLPQPPRRSWWPALRRYPVVTSLMALALLCFPATWPLDAGGCGPLLPWLTMVPVGGGHCEIQFASLRAVLASGQVWRLVTPAFIHFGVAHLLFNAAVVIEFGRRIERGAGSFALLGLTLIVAVASNAAQFLVTNAALFGGLSGVAYGLFAYVVARGRFDTAIVWRVNPSFSVAVIVMLVLLSSGVGGCGQCMLRSAAHWTGLAGGAIAALLWRPTRVNVRG